MLKLLNGLVFAVLISALTTGCGLPCQQTRADYDVHNRQLRSHAGIGEEPIGTGEYHVGMLISESMLGDLLQINGIAFEPLEERLSISGDEAGRRSAVNISVSPRLDRITFMESDTTAARFHFDVHVQLDIRAPGQTREHYLTGSLSIDGHLESRTGTRATPALMAVLETLTEDDLQLGVHALEPAIARAVVGFVGPALSSHLLTDATTFPVMEFPSIEISPVTIELEPVGLVLYPDNNALFIGFVTNLRPEPGGDVWPLASQPVTGMTTYIHPHLATAALQRGFVDNRIINRLDNHLNIDQAGDIGIAVDSIALTEPDQLRFNLSAWDMRARQCGVEPVSIEARLTREESQLAIIPPQNDPQNTEEGAGAWSGLESSPFLEVLFNVTEKTMSLSHFKVGDGFVSLQLTGFEITPQRIILTQALNQN